MITSDSISLAIRITTNTLMHCFCEEFGNFQLVELKELRKSKFAEINIYERKK